MFIGMMGKKKYGSWRIPPIRSGDDPFVKSHSVNVSVGLIMSYLQCQSHIYNAFFFKLKTYGLYSLLKLYIIDVENSFFKCMSP